MTQLQIQFIIDNKDTMKQKEIANSLHVTPACICKIVRKYKQGNLVKMEGYFDMEDFAKKYAQ